MVENFPVKGSFIYPIFLRQLHCFQLVFMSRLPNDIIKPQEQNSQHKRNDCQVFKRVFTKQRFSIKMKKLADHPVTIGGNPYRDGQVVTQFTHVLPRSPGNNNSND